MRELNLKRTAFWRGAIALAVILPLAGCDLLLVTDPDIVTPNNLEDELGLQTLRNGALGEFTAGYAGSGSGDAFIMLGGLMSDEWMHSGTFTSRFRIETRNIDITNGSLQDYYRRLHRARVSLEGAAAVLGGGVDAATDTRIGELLMLAGYTYIAFAESFCSGVPFSFQPETGDIEYGASETTTEILDRAIARFDSALGSSISSDDADAARIGLGRALMNRGKGDFAAAALAVGSVADGFAKFTRHSTNAQRNQIYQLNVSIGRWSLGDGKGGNGLDFRTAADPRITSALCPGCAFDKSEQVPGTTAITDNWQFANYTSWDDPVPVASGIEARLIEAEAQLNVPNVAGWLATLNALRANFSGVVGVINGDASGSLAPLADPGTATGREDLMFRERAFWLFSTGHRMGDLRRLIRQYGRGAETVFPTGVYWKPGATYGTDVNFPVTNDEENNKNFKSCIDRAA